MRGETETCPLSNARTACVGQNHTTEVLKSLELTISLNGRANLFRTRSHSEHALGLDTVVESILRNRRSTAHVLVGRVRARTNQTDLELIRPAVGLDRILELADRGGEIGREGTVDVRLELAEVDLVELVVLGALVLAETVGVLAGKVTDGAALRSRKIIVHAIIEREEGGGGADLSTHVAGMKSVSSAELSAGGLYGSGDEEPVAARRES